MLEAEFRLHLLPGDLALFPQRLAGGFDVDSVFQFLQDLRVRHRDHGGYPLAVALVEVPFNIMQMLVGLIVAVPIMHVVLRVFPQLKN